MTLCGTAPKSLQINDLQEYPSPSPLDTLPVTSKVLDWGGVS